MAVPYRPGQGFDKEALARLRARKQDGTGFGDLPAEDKSQQWSSLLGADAKKVPRCSLCTKPAEGEELLCSACRASPADEALEVNRSDTLRREEKASKKDSGNGTSRSRSATPSTATSEDGDAGRNTDQPRSMGHCRQTALSERSWYADNRWYDAGHRYRYSSSSDWYGYEDAEEYQQTAGLDEMTAQVVREIQEQLQAPGNRGFVWINDWNDKYLKRLGSLRSFLDNHPDKFTVIPNKGKGFRVALAMTGHRSK